ncbi:MAG: peptidylprolyl isomerase [Bacteroidia bacterium]
MILLLACCLSTFAYSQTLIDFYTTKGNFRVQLREDLMPITAGNFISLVDTGFYDGIIFHRVVQGFVIQGGDPLGNGFGGPGYTIQDEYHPSMNPDSAGVIAMAKTSQPNSAGSQFYFSLDTLPQLDTTYAVFGSCIEGIDVIFDIGSVRVDNRDRPLFNIRMDSLRIVDPAASRDLLQAEVLTEVYPNPFSEQANIRFRIRHAGQVVVTIQDMRGRKVATLLEEPKAPGIYDLLWDARAFGAGSYILSVATEHGVSSRTLVKVNRE